MNDLPDTVLGEKSNGIILTDLRITPDAVFDKLLKLNKGKAQGPDEVPPRVLLELSKEMSVLFCSINLWKLEKFQQTERMQMLLQF